MGTQKSGSIAPEEPKDGNNDYADVAGKMRGTQHQKTTSIRQAGLISSQLGAHGQREDESKQSRHRRAPPASLP